jgi:hypothetical protein
LLITQGSSNCHLASSLDESGNSLIMLMAACISHLGALPSAGVFGLCEHVHGGSSISPGSGVGTSLCYLGLLWLAQSTVILALSSGSFGGSGGQRVGSIESIRSMDSSSSRLSSVATDSASTLSTQAHAEGSLDQ